MKKISIIFSILFSIIFLGVAANAQEQEDTIYKMSEVDEKPVVTKKPKARAVGKGGREHCEGEGKARVRVILHKSGRVGEIALVKSSGCSLFDNSALDAAKKIEFKPGKKDGKDVSVVVVMEYSYFII